MTGPRPASGGLTPQQIAVLLQPVAPGRVRRDPGGNSYLPQQDIRAHLTRIFGFAGWSSHVLETAMVFEAPATKKDAAPGRIDCLWRATVRLEVRDQYGNHLATYEDSATGDAQNQTPLAGHDLALKSAVSTALKRAASSLGDQFGLSLYNKGSLDQFVGPFVFGLGGAPSADVSAATEETDPDARPPRDEGPDETLSPAAAGADGAEDRPRDVDHNGQALASPEDRAEYAVAGRHADRERANAARHGSPEANRKARLWDAVTEYVRTLGQAVDRTAELEHECTRRGWNMPAQLHPDRLDELADYYEEKTDDDIRARIARGE